MRIVIVGDGKIGSALAEQLSREGHEITIVDRSGAPLQRTVEDLDILSIEGMVRRMPRSWRRASTRRSWSSR